MNLEKNTDAVANEADKALQSTFAGLGSWQRLAVVAAIIIGIFIILQIIDGFINRQLN